MPAKEKTVPLRNKQFIDWPKKGKIVGLFNIQKMDSHSVKILGKGMKQKVRIAGPLFI